MKYLSIKEGYLPRSANGGLFLSQGYGRHPERKIPSFEIIFMRNGQLVMEEDGHKFTLQKNDALVLIANKTHRGLSEYDEHTSFYWIHFHLDRRKYAILDNPENRAGYYSIKQLSHFNRPERMIDLFCQFLHRQEEGFPSQMEANLLVAQMLIELAFYAKRQPITKSTERLASRAKKIIDTEFHHPYLTTRTVADKLEMSSDYLGRIFKQVYGHSIGSYILITRMREARRLLQESDLNINQIALASGFSDPGYFRRMFRKHFDMRPSELRKLHFRTHINIR